MTSTLNKKNIRTSISCNPYCMILKKAKIFSTKNTEGKWECFKGVLNRYICQFILIGNKYKGAYPQKDYTGVSFEFY